MAASATRVGFIGLGAMGYPMASVLHSAGISVEVLDRSEDLSNNFVEEHAQARRLRSVSDLSEDIETVILMLPDSKAVDAVVLGTDGMKGLVDVLPPSALIIDMSSSNPVRTRELAERLKARQIHLVDAPVSGGVKKAASGSLAVMVGGEPEQVQRATSLLNLMGGSVTHVGSVGCGHALKALNNYIAAVSFVSAAEALLVAERFGLDLSLMTDVLNQSSGKNSTTDYKVKQFILSGTFNSGFSLQLMAKDVGIALDLARSTGQPLQLGDQMGKLWGGAAASFKQSIDHTVMYKLIAGREIR
ncbi:NAD(P)-dependent oxidoreductase [Imbroritus primus]|uniref:NAD(P)-dependent oxidoreductase n=1 Tax=Imbroritus primus TaxID=3058603 RepID=A0ACD3SL00_9BURK|nr:NAD(P)-dependent oxidoreductase [Burkholderiaceae bacterium PBA]